MSRYTNNDNYGTPFGLQDNREWSGQYALTPQRHWDAPVFGNPSRSVHGTESSAPPINFWPNNALPGRSAHSGNAWPGGSHSGETNLGPPTNIASQSELDLDMNVWDLLPGPAILAAPPIPQRRLAPIPVGPWQSAPSRDPYGNSTGPIERRPDVQPPTRGDPAPVPPPPPFQSRGEWWDPPNAATFRCEWTTTRHGTGTQRCAARIAGDRRSVTSHLRDEHGFTCDGETIPCAWTGCTTGSMQRRNIPRHIVACHMAIKVPCPGCGMLLSRADANKKHRQACMGARVRSPGSEDYEAFY